MYSTRFVAVAALVCFAGGLLLPVAVFFAVVAGWWPVGRLWTAFLILSGVIVAFLADRFLKSF